jgi:hypothetical protein
LPTRILARYFYALRFAFADSFQFGCTYSFPIRFAVSLRLASETRPDWIGFAGGWDGFVSYLPGEAGL